MTRNRGGLRGLIAGLARVLDYLAAHYGTDQPNFPNR